LDYFYEPVESQKKSHSREGEKLFFNELWIPVFQAVADSVDIPNLAQLVPSPSREKDRMRVPSVVLSIPLTLSLSPGGERTRFSVACS